MSDTRDRKPAQQGGSGRASGFRRRHLAIIAVTLLALLLVPTSLDGGLSNQAISELEEDGSFQWLQTWTDDAVLWERPPMTPDRQASWLILRAPNGGFNVSDLELPPPGGYERIETPAVVQSDYPVGGLLADGTPVVIGFDIAIDGGLEVATGPPTLWLYEATGDWVAHPIDVVLPPAEFVAADIARDAESGMPIDEVLRWFGGWYIDQATFGLDEGRLWVRGIDLSTDAPFHWVEGDDGVLRPRP